MKCPHCQTDFFAKWDTTLIPLRKDAIMRNLGESGLDPRVKTTVCPNCMGPIFTFTVEPASSSVTIFSTSIYPRGGKFPPAPPEVPAEISSDFSEANEVLPVSPKASAALSRRCLQAILSAHGYAGRDLVKQVDAALSETDARKALPMSVRENMDAIRNFGNFSAHPITDQTTLQVLEVEEGEAEWCLQILLDLFEHYYVIPARSAAKRAALAAKLASAGKPPMRA